MSFDRIFFGVDIHVYMAPSTQIKENFLVAFAELEQIKSKTKASNLDRIHDQISNIIRVYNNDVKYINHEDKTFEASEFKSFEAFCKFRHGEPIESLQKEYDEEKNIVAIHNAKRINELFQLKQLGGLCSTLADKITRTVEQLKRCDSIAEKIPSCHLESLAFDPHLFEPQLKRIEDPIQKSQAIASEPVALTQDQAPAAIAANETPVPLPSIHSDITVTYDVGYGNSLGICCEPTWAENPIVFTNHRNGWTGQVPVDKDWKFVVLQNDRILKWENGTNRRCDAHTNALTINANEVKFS